MLLKLASGLRLPPTGVVADDGCKDGGGDAEYSFDVVMFGSASRWRRCTGRWQIMTHGPAGNRAGRGVLLFRRGGGRNENSVHFPAAKSVPPLNVVIKIVAGKWPLFFRGRRPGPGFWGGPGAFPGDRPVALVQLLARPRPAGKNEGPDQHG